MRPISIKRFEIFYLLSFVVGLLNMVVAWDATMQQMAAAGPGMEDYGPAIMVGSVAIGALITLLLWFFAARKASNIARWIIVIFFAISLLSNVMSLARGSFPDGLGAVIAIVSLLLEAAAVVMLFQPDARAWFANDEAVGADTFE